MYRNYNSITKKSRVISCHSLFTAWECKQTWLLLNFVPTISFTSSQFPAYEKRQWYIFSLRNLTSVNLVMDLMVRVVDKWCVTDFSKLKVFLSYFKISVLVKKMTLFKFLRPIVHWRKTQTEICSVDFYYLRAQSNIYDGDFSQK